MSSPSHDRVLARNDTAGIRMGGGSVEDFIRKVNQWKTYVNETVPRRIEEWKAESERPALPEETEALLRKPYDVIVVGFGAAGSAAALDAADAGKKVLLVDRFDGGGSTRRSGGIYYAGGGTRAQIAAGIKDTPENMYNYVRQENEGCVDDDTIRRFAHESPHTFEWLETRVGVPFKSSETKDTVYYERKTSYPPSFATLYSSGNEQAYPFTLHAQPAARGNRPFGDYLTGNILFNALEKSVEAHPNITLVLHCSLEGLLMSPDGKRCLGAKFRLLDERAHSTHVMLHEIGSGAPFFDASRAIDETCRKRESELFASFSVAREVKAKAGVIVCTGGFFYNSEMVKRHAPKYLGFMPLGNMGDDGSGISVAERDGRVKLGNMNRCSAWKFINPPFSFVRGVLVNTKGERVGNEDTYGATFADFLVQKHGGKGWLIIDQAAWEEANEDCMNPDSGLQEDQRMQGLANLHRNNKSADTIEELAKKIGAESLAATMKEYNADAAKGGSDNRFHKVSKYVVPLTEGPFYAINLNMTGNKYWPTPSMSLGGIVVEGASGRALSATGGGEPIEGLYAAGKCAVGIASNYYVSGLSLADAVFSGRRAGRHAAGVTGWVASGAKSSSSSGSSSYAKL